MVRKWFLLLIVMMATWAGAQEQVKVEGKLKGYFLAPDGTLAVYEVPFAFPKRPLKENLPEQLFPLWAHYYIQARVESINTPIKGLQIRVGRQSVAVRVEGTKYIVTVPEIPEQWLQVHSKAGLELQITVELTDGTKTQLQPQYATKLGDVQRLKIDWRDLERIAKIRQFLQEQGDKLLPGLRADEVPFLLEGEEGQWVLVGKGFSEWWRYRGIKPYGLDIFLPPFRFFVPPEIKERVPAGVVKTRYMGIVVILHYQNGWDNLEEIEKPEESYRHGERTFALIHEVIHYWFGKKFGWGERPKSTPFTDLDGYLAWMMEGNSLSRALNAIEPEQRLEAIKDFLLFRWYRRRLGCSNTEGEQQEELEEGAATFLAEKAIEIGREQLKVPLIYLPSPFFLELEPFEQPIPDLTLPFDPIIKARDWGYVQAKLLDEVEPNWFRLLGNQQGPLDELLAKAVGFDPVKVAALPEGQVRKEIRVHAQNRGWIKPLPSAIKDGFEVVVLAPLSPLKDVPNAFDCEWLTFSSCDVVTKGFQIKSEREVMFSQIQSRGGKVLAFRWMLPTSIVLRLRQEKKNEMVVLEGQGIKVEIEKSVVWRTPKGIVLGDKNWAKAWALAHAEKSEEVTPMKLSEAWTILTLAAVAAFGSGAAQAQGVQVNGVISGRFLNTWTNTVEYRVIEFVPDPDLSEYSVLEPLDDEQYEITIQVTDPEGKLLRLSLLLTDGQEVSVASEQPTDQLTLTHRDKWYKILRPIGELVEWMGKVAIKVLKTTGEQALERFLKDWLQGKKKGTLAIHVHIVDPEQNSFSPFPSVILEIWRGNKRVLPPPNAPWIIEPNEKGEKSIPLPEAPDYLVRAIKTVQVVACEEVWRGPYKIEKDKVSNAQIIFYYHKGIKGRVVEQTSGGQVPLSGAIASLWKGNTKVSEDQASSTDGYFTIPALHIDTALNQYGSGTYYLKVVPPSRSMQQPQPPSYPTPERPTNVTLTKCERTKPNVECPRALTIDAGIFVFTYKPAFPGPGGGEN